MQEFHVKLSNNEMVQITFEDGSLAINLTPAELRQKLSATPNATQPQTASLPVQKLEFPKKVTANTQDVVKKITPKSNPAPKPKANVVKARTVITKALPKRGTIKASPRSKR